MADPADLTHEVLVRVAEFLRKLPASQLASLASGETRLELVGQAPGHAHGAPRGEQSPLPARQPVPPAALPKPLEEIAATLAALPDRASAVSYLDDLRLSVPQLRSLAAGLGIAVSSKVTKGQARDTIVQWTVGRRVDAAVLSRPDARRF